MVLFFEIGAGIRNVFIGNSYLLPNNILPTNGISSSDHPCNEMKTDVLLSHVPNTRGECRPLGGRVLDEYVVYDVGDNRNPVLLTLGGSTTTGYYQNISNGETYPKRLANLAKDKFYIVNGGVGGYTSLQELYKFIRDGSRIRNLEVVVSLNGINELPDYQGLDNERQIYYPFLTRSQYMMNNRQVWIDKRFSKINLMDFFPNINSLIVHLVSQYSKWSIVTIQEGYNKGLFEAVGAAERWEHNVSRLHKLVALQDAHYFVFLQPTMGLLGAQSNPKPGTSDAEIYKLLSDNTDMRNLYKQLKKRCSNLVYCFDISDSVPPTGDVYDDPRHHNANGNDLLAREIWKIISSKMEEQKNL